MTQDSLTQHPESRRARLRYVPGIDGLRAVSVLAVLLYHYFVLGQAGGLGGPLDNWMPGGFMGVEVFFVISGYLITSLLLGERRRQGSISLKTFWLRRARRLLPALFVMLALVVLVALLFLPDTLQQLKRDVVGALTYTSNWWQINAPYAAQEGRPPLLNHLWSLAIEEQFYLFWPPLLVLGLSRLGRVKTFWLVVAVAFASAALMAVVRGTGVGSTDPSAAYFSTLTRLSGLLLGSALAFVWAPYMIRRRPGRGVRFLLDAVGVIGLFLLYRSFRATHFEAVSTFRGGFLVVDLATLLVIAATVHPASDLGRALGVRPLQWIGQRSYGIYLWHYPIFVITRPSLDITWWPPIIVLVRFGLTVGLAELSYRYVETPIRAGAIGQYVDRLRAARGRHRRRLTLGGIGVVCLLSVVAFSLGAGLAGADSNNSNDDVPAAQSEEGDEPAPAALATVCERVGPNSNLDEVCADIFANTTAGPTGQTTAATSTTTIVASTTAAPVVDPNAVPTTLAAVTTTVAPPPPPPVPIGIGDSVMLGAQNALQNAMPGMIVDAVKSRQFAHAIAVIQFYKDIGQLPQSIVIHLGTNGRFGDPEFDHMMSVIGPDRFAFFLTARMPRSWEGEVNATLTAGVSRHTNARLLDWRQYSGCHSDWFANDGFHLTSTGRAEYARFVQTHTMGDAATLVYCP